MSIGSIALGVVGGVAGFMTGGIGFALVGVAMGVAAGMLIDPTGSNTQTPGTPQTQNLDLPTIEEGTPIYDIFGTSKVVGHLLWYGKSKTKPIKEKQESGGKGGGGKTEKAVVGYKYYLTWAQGICLGPVDEIYTIYRDDDPVWSGNLTRPASGGEATVTLEGMGSCTIYFGTDDQVANTTIGEEEGTTVNPPYRGLCWAFFDNCMIGTFNRAPVMRFIVRKTPQLAFNASHLIGTYDYNAAHLIYTVLTSSRYVGFPSVWVNEDSFSAFANLMAQSGEQHGLSMLMTAQEPGTRILENTLTHVDAVMRYGVDGKFHLHANRSYEAVGDLPSIDQSMFLKPMVLERKGWVEVSNELQIQHHLRYFFDTGEEADGGTGFDPDDDFSGANGDPPDTDRWSVLYVSGDTGDVNRPAINGNRLWWVGAKLAEGSGEADYKVVSRFWFENGQDMEFQWDFLKDTIISTGTGAFTPLWAGLTDSKTVAVGGNRDYVYVYYDPVNGLRLYANLYSVSYGPVNLTDNHFPLTMRMRREYISGTNCKVGVQMYNRVTLQWEDLSGNPDQYTWSGTRPEYVGYFQFRFDTDCPGTVPTASVAGGVDDFSVLEGAWGCYVDAEEGYANDDFTGDDGDEPNTTLWTNIHPGVTTIQGNRLYMPTNYKQVTSKCYLGGDFDVQVDADVTPMPTIHSSYGWHAIMQFYIDASNYMSLDFGKHGGGGATPQSSSDIVIGGVSAPSVSGYLSNTTAKFRFVREGDVATCYYYGYPNPGWNQVYQKSGFPLDDGQIILRTVSVAYVYYVYWDNYTINAGSVRDCIECPEYVPPEGVLNIRRAAVTGDDRGAMEMQGRAITKSAQLMGFGNSANANWAADRGIRRAAYPFAQGLLTLNRMAFEREVGDLFKLSDTEHSIVDMVCRVNLIGEGKLDSEEINITFMEEPDYVTSMATLSEQDTEGGRRVDTVSPLEDVAVVESPYVLSGDAIEIIPLASRVTGNEVGYELWISIDNGTSYQFLQNVDFYAIKGALVTALSEDMLTLDTATTLTVDFGFDDDAQDIETITRTAMLAPTDNIMLVGDEVITFETITPDGSTDGRYHITNLNRGWYDTIREAWAVGTDVWFLGVNALQTISSANFIAGATRKFKMVPYNSRYVGDISGAVEVALTMEGRGKQPYTPGNFRANGNGRYPLYQMNVELTWDPRVRGVDAGINDPDTVTDAAPTWEGLFEIEVVVGAATVRTVTAVDALSWIYTYAMNVADNGGLASEVTFNLTNYKDSGGVRYDSRHSRTITVKRNPDVTATTTTTTTTTT